MSNRINQADLAKRIAKRHQLSLDEAENQIDHVCDEIYEALKQGESVTIRNFGNFYVKPRSGRT